MKKRGLSALLAGALAAALCAGCGPGVQSPVQTANTQAQRFESYVAQTSFDFPKSWRYQSGEEMDEGLQAVFTFDGGRAAVQFLWMDAQQRANNVFLEQLEIDDVKQTNCRAGAYSGKLATGRQGATRTAAFEGSRGWYDTGLVLVMRAVVQADTEDAYLMQKRNLDALLSSVEVGEDSNLPAIAQEDFATYDFTDTFGLSVRAPSFWDMQPQSATDGSLAIRFTVAQGDNIVTVERGRMSHKEYQEMLQSVASLGAYDDTFQFDMQQKGQTASFTCIQEGKINRSTLTAVQDGGDVTYTWVTSALRPQLDKAYADVVQEIAQSVQAQ